ncbi:ShlB/FhaC/HecB family hemolysin secretion/activation protein [Aurantiacibacter flavus]|uniref:ShlB/FhaC/HecB family hemolysin secretion/activation protein n=1 Tax=Aurantiacibacter flavus TaxID=3145232 RepID=A0ABV0D0U6_9SPHN
MLFRKELLLGVALVASPAFAQSASQVVPDSYAPVAQQPGGPVVIPQDMPSQVPEGAEDLVVTLNGVRIEGAGVDPALVAALEAKLLGKPVKVAAIFAAAHELERAFSASGEALTRVVVPAQDLADGATLRLVVVQGRIEAVDTEALPRAVKGNVAAYLQSLVGKPGVKISQIERKLLLASDLPGFTMRSTLIPGSKPGMSILAVEGDYRPLGALVGFNNLQSDGLGREAVSLGFDLNGIAGLGETIYLRASGDPSGDYFDKRPRNRVLAAGVVAPLGNDGLSLNIEGIDARTAGNVPINRPRFASHFRRLSTRLSYPFILSRTTRLTGSIAFDVAEENINLIEPSQIGVSRDRLRVARLGGDFATAFASGGRMTAAMELSQGLNIPGARSAADATPTLPLSRAGADADFTALSISAGLDWPFAEHLSGRLSASAQTSFGYALVNSESFGIAHGDAISTLSQGTLQGDTGYAVRGELQAPFSYTTQNLFVAPYVFGANGRVLLKQSSALERRDTTAWAYGAGVRLAGNHTVRWGLNAEYGAAEVDGIRGAPERFSLSFQLSY